MDPVWPVGHGFATSGLDTGVGVGGDGKRHHIGQPKSFSEGRGGAPKKKATGFLRVNNFSAVYFRNSYNSGSEQPMIYIPAGVKDIVLSLPSMLCVFV